MTSITVRRASYELLNDPLLNKGIAFTEAERDAFGLHGLLPPHVGKLDEQVERRLKVLQAFETDLERYDFLRDMQDNNETACYALLTREIAQMLPLVYTPTVGLGCQRFSQIYRKPRGLFLSYPNRGRLAGILADPRFDAVRTIVVTDGERILGLGDLGAGGMGIPIGKLSLYTACGGLHPSSTLPILLDVGTDRQELLNDPLYLGWKHGRVRGQEYDDFLEAFVSAVAARWPEVLLQWEDFSRDNATRLLNRYRDRLCTFNDDIQGTAAVAVGTLLSALAVAGTPLAGQRVVILGAGSAGCGIAGLLSDCMTQAGLDPQDARAAIYMVDKAGLLVEGMSGLLPFQKRFARAPDEVTGWQLDASSRIELADVICNVRPTALIGVSGQGGAFTEEMIRAMASQTARPIVLPLSNPTQHSEATPADLLAWTDGRALVGTGSPFPETDWNGKRTKAAQTNNVYVFPGMGLGVIASRAQRITDGMFMAAARALADMSPARLSPDVPLLPPTSALRDVALKVALAVADQAQRDGVAGEEGAISETLLRALMWRPDYQHYVRADDAA